MGVLGHKLWRDLWHAKTRTGLAVLSTAVGLIALGISLSLSATMTARMSESFQTSRPPHLIFWARGEGFDASTCAAIKRFANVRTCQTSGEFSIRWKRPGERNWRVGTLQTIDDVHHQEVHVRPLVAGTWPQGRALAVERQTARYLHLEPGSEILVEVRGRARRLPVSGIVRDPLIFPPQFGGKPTFITTPSVALWLTGNEQDNVLSVQLAHVDRTRAREVGERIKERFRQVGISVSGPWILDPQRHFLQDQVDTLMRILLILSSLSLGLSVFLIINTMNAIVVQQMWQIGVLKVLGARRWHILLHYFSMTLVYGILAIVLAVPVAAVGAHVLAAYLLDFINISVGSFQVDLQTVAIQGGTGLLVPLLGALFPVWGALRITVQESLRTRGIGGHFGRGWMDRLLVHIRFLSRPALLSLRNTFRRKTRISLTLLALTFGGVMFIMVMSVGHSLNRTLDEILNEFGGHAWVVFRQPYRVEQLVSVARQDPAVEYVEVWHRVAAVLETPSGEKKQVGLRGMPVPSRIFGARIVAGRSLLPGDGRAILLNEKIARENGIHVSDVITTRIGDKQVTWTVVGLVYSVQNNHTENFVPFDALARVSGTVNRGERVYLFLRKEAREHPQTVVQRLRQTYEKEGLHVTAAGTMEEFRRSGRNEFNILTYTLLVMSVLAAVVGSIGLMGTLSINVVERRREIGILRSIGAHNRALIGIFVLEGVVVGICSWLLAGPLSVPLSWVFAREVADLMNIPMGFHYSVPALVAWLGIVALSSVFASLVPAWQATRVTVREALAYE